MLLNFCFGSAPPKVTHLKIIGDIREGNVVSISANIVGGVEDVSRVQWFKSDASVNEANLEAISSSKVAKVPKLTYISTFFLLLSLLIFVLYAW